jgi:hypothetical protein
MRYGTVETRSISISTDSNSDALNDSGSLKMNSEA